MAAKECPMCGETMRLSEREIVERVPGSPQTTTTKFSEWICPECDYFEEVEDSEN
jgi:uncharacterized protein with PIN domain